VTMYEDAVKTSGHQGEIEVRELSELVLESLALEPAAPGRPGPPAPGRGGGRGGGAPPRPRARGGGRRARRELRIEGIATTVPLHLRLVDDERIRAGDVHTGYLEDLLAGGGPDPELATKVPERAGGEP
jgi:hypothetical protein